MIEQKKIDWLNALPILEVAVRLGLKVDRHNLCLCPFHEESEPSLKIYDKSNSFYCFGCARHGRVIDLVEGSLNLKFVSACNWLKNNFNTVYDVKYEQHVRSTSETPFDAEKYGKYFIKPILNTAARQFLFGERRLDPKVIDKCRISSWIDRNGTPLLQIPYFDINGRLVGVQWRNLSRDGPRFRFPKGSRNHIYNLPILRALRTGDTLFIAEGPSDCWSMLSAGYNAIAVPSATLLKPNDLEILKAFACHIVPDNDMAGEELYRKIRRHIPVVRHQLPAWCKDYSDYYVTTLNNNTL